MFRSRNRIYSALLVVLALLTASSLVAAPVDRWHERGPLPNAPYLREIVYGNGLFVAVGYGATNGLLATSRDGRIWSVQPNNIYLARIAFGNGLFVAFGGGDNPYRGLVTHDGLNWTQITLPSTDSALFGVSDVTYASQGFLAVGAYMHWHIISPLEHFPETHGYFASSSNGYTWGASFGSPSLEILGAITYGRSALVGIDTGGRLLVSTNGPWITAVTNPPARFISVSFEGDKFLAGGEYYQSSTGKVCQVYISTNARDWTPHSISNCLRDVSFGEGIYAAVDDRTISTSPDGVVWTRQYEHLSARFTSIAYGAGTFVAVGEGGTIAQSDPFRPILAIRAAGANLQLEVVGEPGNYEVHSTPDFKAWFNAGPFTHQGSLTVLDLPGTGAQTFYRVVRVAP